MKVAVSALGSDSTCLNHLLVGFRIRLQRPCHTRTKASLSGWGSSVRTSCRPNREKGNNYTTEGASPFFVSLEATGHLRRKVISMHHCVELLKLSIN